MKIEEMNGEQLMSAMAELAVPIGNIMANEKMADAWKKIGQDAAAGKLNVAIQQRGAIVREVVPAALKNNANDVFKVISVLNGVPVAELKKMNGMEVFKMVTESLSSELLTFFTSFGTMGSKK